MRWTLLYDTFGVRFFVFNDDEWFPGGKARLERVDALERELRRRDLDVMMSIKCRADDVEEGLFRRLLDMGVVRAYVGVESGSDHSLATLNKHTTVAQNRSALETLHRVGMLADFGLIFFDPDSTVEDVRANLDFFHEMAGAGQAPLSFGRMEVYAGTRDPGPPATRGAPHRQLPGLELRHPRPARRAAVPPDDRRHAPAALRERRAGQALLGRLLRADDVHVPAAGARQPAAHGRGARRSLPRVNNHSLALLEEMFDYVRRENIYDARRVNDQAAAWAGRANLFDFEVGQELASLRARISQDALWPAGGS